MNEQDNKVIPEDILNDSFSYRDFDVFERLFIYEGRTAYEISKMYKVHDAVIYDWIKRHGLPKHKDKEAIIERYGQAVYDNIVAHRKATYSKSNKKNMEKYVGKSYEEKFGKERAKEIKDKISKTQQGICRLSPEQIQNLKSIRKGASNPNWKGGYYSIQYKKLNRGPINRLVSSMNTIYIFEYSHKCSICGLESFSNQAHHVLSLSYIFGKICQKSKEVNKLDIEFVMNHIYNFHKLYMKDIYICLCSKCHTEIHKQKDKIDSMMKDKIHLIDDYVNHEPSFKI